MSDRVSISFSEIHPQDDLSIAAIIRQVLTEFGANRPGFAWADPELDHLSQAYSAANAVYLVARAGDRVVGGGGIAPFPCEFEGICELQKMYLLPDFRGQGIGKSLMAKLMAAAQGHGYRGCYIETFDAMQAAIELYRRSGFHFLGHPLGNSGHTSCNRFLLRWLNEL